MARVLVDLKNQFSFVGVHLQKVSPCNLATNPVAHLWAQAPNFHFCLKVNLNF